MKPEELKKLVLNILNMGNREKWSGILTHFIEVLKINIFIVDFEGRILLPPVKGRYGSEFFNKPAVTANLFNEPEILISKFRKYGSYLEHQFTFNLHSFAIPITAKDTEESVFAYFILGPIILNERLDQQEYQKIAKTLNLPVTEILDTLNEVRALSSITLKSILDLLSEIVKYGIELNLQRQGLEKMCLNKEVLSQEANETAQDIYSSIYFDELLVTLLDVALSMTKAECGSIMVLDNEKGDLVIKVSRGIDKSRARNTRLKFGEGVAGVAFKQKKLFVISGTDGDDKIKHLLKRPDIKRALVMPLFSQNNVFGIMNLHTKKTEDIISDQESLEILSHLSKLTAVAMLNLQQKTSTTT